MADSPANTRADLYRAALDQAQAQRDTIRKLSLVIAHTRAALLSSHTAPTRIRNAIRELDKAPKL